MAKIRSSSFAAGKCESVFWKRTNKQEVSQILLAARKFERTSRQPGNRNGALGFVALEIVELFSNLVDFKTGRLDPSLETLMRMLNRSKDAISRALKALKDHGFLNWLRRYVPTGNQGRGPQVKQTSNAYRMFMPGFARRLLGRYGQPSPEPVDLEDLRLTRLSELKEQLSGLPLAELPQVLLEDGPLARALSRLGSNIEKKRESARRGEYPSGFLIDDVTWKHSSMD